MTSPHELGSTGASTRASVVILNGFLGSGKTTLFRNLLAQAKQRNLATCAIVNDMSELDIDGELIGNTRAVEENTGVLRSIHSCVLGSKQGIAKLDAALEELLSRHAPELVIIETSGGCHPLPLVEYFNEHGEVDLKGVFVLVDSLMLAHDYEYGETLVPRMQNNMAQGRRGTENLLVEQIMFCNHLILTKADRIKEQKLREVAGFIQSINPFVTVLSVIYGRLSIDYLLELQPYDYSKVADLVEELKPALEAEENDDRPYDLATRVIKDDRPFHPQRLWDTCHRYLDQRIYRSKGFFWLASRSKLSLLWNQAAGSISLEMVGYWRSGLVEDEKSDISESERQQLKEMLAEKSGRFGDRRCDLTVIGDQSQVDRFTEALRSCFLTEDEIARWEKGRTFPDPWPKKVRNIAG
ncbi:MAG: GTP-binding protein [Acidobacteriota bacterium]